MIIFIIKLIKLIFFFFSKILILEINSIARNIIVVAYISYILLVRNYILNALAVTALVFLEIRLSS